MNYYQNYRYIQLLIHVKISIYVEKLKIVEKLLNNNTVLCNR